MYNEAPPYLLQLRDLELKLCRTILGMLKLSFEPLSTVIAFNLFLQFANSALVLLDLTPQLSGCTVLVMQVTFLH